MVELKQDEIIEKQRLDSLEDFRNKSHAIQAEIRNYEIQLNNIKELFKSEYKKLIDENKFFGEELRNKLRDLDDKSALAIAILKDAQNKLDNANKLESDLKEKIKNHQSVSQEHSDYIIKEKDELHIHKSQAKENLDTSLDLMQKAQKLMNEAIEAKNSLTQEGDRLGHILANIEIAKSALSEMKIKNELVKSELQSLKSECLNLQSQADSDKAEALKIRDDCDVCTARLAKRKEELDEMAKNLKSASIRQDVVAQNQMAKEQSINEQIGKLSQLKSDVEILLKQKESKGA